MNCMSEVAGISDAVCINVLLQCIHLEGAVVGQVRVPIEVGVQERVDTASHYAPGGSQAIHSGQTLAAGVGARCQVPLH